MRCALLTIGLAGATACSSVIVSTKSSTALIGRTMELGIPLSKSELEQIFLHSRGTIASGGIPSRYGYLGVQLSVGNLSTMLATTEGINEAGLTVSAQTHDSAEYEQNGSNIVEIWDVEVTAYLLACCGTVDEAAHALSSVKVLNTPLVGSLGKVHWHVQDGEGASRVLEYINGKLKVYDNAPIGVLTNDPSYEWQLGHLNLWAGYPTSTTSSPFAYSASSGGPSGFSSVGDVVPALASHGLNTRSLPGGYTPPE